MFGRWWCATWLGHRPYVSGPSMADWQRDFTSCRCGKVRQVPGEVRWNQKHPWDRLPD